MGVSMPETLTRQKQVVSIL